LSDDVEEDFSEDDFSEDDFSDDFSGEEAEPFFDPDVFSLSFELPLPPVSADPRLLSVE
jgi:hypothetical protein